jgi:hypothetical protein
LNPGKLKPEQVKRKELKLHDSNPQISMAKQVSSRSLSFPSAPRPYRSQPNNIQSHQIFEIESLLQISVRFSLLAPSAKGHASCISGLRGTD